MKSYLAKNHPFAIKTFGCLAYAHNRPKEKDKFGARSRRCIFMGYPLGKKGWKLYDLETRKIFVSRDAFIMNTYFLS